MELVASIFMNAASLTMLSSANAKETTIYLILHQHATLRSLIGPRSATLILVSSNVSDVSFN